MFQKCGCDLQKSVRTPEQRPKISANPRTSLSIILSIHETEKNILTLPLFQRDLSGGDSVDCVQIDSAKSTRTQPIFKTMN